MDRVARGGRRAGRLVIGGCQGAAEVGGRSGKSVGAESWAGGGAVGSCSPHTKVPWGAGIVAVF